MSEIIANPTIQLHPSDNKIIYVDCTELLAGSLIDGGGNFTIVNGSITVAELAAIGSGGVVTEDGVEIGQNQGFSMRVSGMQRKTEARVSVEFPTDASGETLGVDVIFKCQKP